MSLSIRIELPKVSYIGGERVEGTLIVKVPPEVSLPVRVPGIIIDASSKTELLRYADAESETGTDVRTTDEEPYKQQLRVAMPKSGDKEITFPPGSVTNYPFGLILPPDLFPSYYSSTVRPEDGARFEARLSYELKAGAVPGDFSVKVETEPASIQIVPVALPYGPQPRKGYIVPVYSGLSDNDSEAGEGSEAGANPPPAGSDQDSEHANSNSDNDEEAAHDSEEEKVPEKKKKAKAGCSGSSKKKKAASEAADKKSVKSAKKSAKAKSERHAEIVREGQAKLSLTMQSAYICLEPTSDVGRGNHAPDQNVMWVEVRMSNQMRESTLPFQLRITLKLQTTYRVKDEDPVENTVILASRNVKAILSSHGSDGQLLLKPGEATPMRLSLAIPQSLALDACEPTTMTRKGDPAPHGARSAVKVPVPPTVETTSFDARTLLEVDIKTLKGRTKNNSQVLVLEDPVEIVGLPFDE